MKRTLFVLTLGLGLGVAGTSLAKKPHHPHRPSAPVVVQHHAPVVVVKQQRRHRHYRQRMVRQALNQKAFMQARVDRKCRRFFRNMGPHRAQRMCMRTARRQVRQFNAQWGHLVTASVAELAWATPRPHRRAPVYAPQRPVRTTQVVYRF